MSLIEHMRLTVVNCAIFLSYVILHKYNYYENHQSVEWARITESLPRPLSLNILMKFLSHTLKVCYNDQNNGKTRFRNLSLFSLAITEKLPTKKPVVKSSPFPIMSYIIFILKSPPRAFPRLLVKPSMQYALSSANTS